MQTQGTAPTSTAEISGTPRPRGAPPNSEAAPSKVRAAQAAVCVTKRRSSWACTGNPKLEQETIGGTHAQETSPYQRRPTTLHEGQGSNPPIRALYMQLAKIPHTHQTTPRATIAPGTDKPARHPPRAQQVPAQRTHNSKRGAGATPRRPRARLDTGALGLARPEHRT